MKLLAYVTGSFMLWMASAATASATTVLPMRFESVTVEQGLAQNSVIAIEQDADGFLWFGTENGLDRYDGYRFTHFSDSRSAENFIPADYINDLETASDGTLWVATGGGGLLRWNSASAAFEALDIPEIGDGRVSRIVADPRGLLWVGTQRFGLYRVDIQTLSYQVFRSDADDPSALASDEVRALSLDSDGTLWVGTNRGLGRLAPGASAFTHLKAGEGEDSLGDNRIRALLRDRAGKLWVGTRGAGLFRLRDDQRTFDHYAYADDEHSALASNRVEALLEDDNGRLWIATAGGLSVFIAGTERPVRIAQQASVGSALSDSNTISLLQDRGGLLWVGTRTGGVNKWNPRTWAFGHYVPDSDSPRERGITALAESTNGNVWFGSFGGGLVGVDAERQVIGQFRRDTDVSISDNRVMALAQGTRNVLWVGTMGGGLNRIDLDTNSVQAFTHDETDPGSLSANGVMSLRVDHLGGLWVGTFGGGVSYLANGEQSFKHFRHDPDDPTTLSGMRATAIAEDARQHIWVGTESHGLNRKRLGQSGWDRLQLSEAGGNPGLDSIYAVHVDTDNRIWVGTRGGLVRIENADLMLSAASIRIFTEADGLPDDNIYGIQSDERGRIWISSGRGLSSMAADGSALRNYYVSHGLQGTEFNFGAHAKGGSGLLYFGGSNGFNRFDPTHIGASAAPPAIELVGLRVAGQPINAGGVYDGLRELSLDYTDDHVVFEFAALDYAAPDRNQFAYRLDGFDNDWVNAGTEHRTTYTNLPAGDYRFFVRAANSDGVWSEAEIDLTISVSPPPWQTPWAYALYLFALVSGAWAIWFAQQRKLRMREEYSERLREQVRLRTSELDERNRELQRANDQLHNASYTDMLTGLKNRRYFFEEIGQAIENLDWPDDIERRSATESGEFVFLMVDLDHFKPVNDTYGHVAGDQMLTQVAAALQSACRSNDTVIRWGGDEFLVVARRADAEEAALLAERVRAAIAGCVFSLGNGKVARTSSSIGLAAYPFFDHEPRMVGWEQVLKIADIAMYASKEQRNAWTSITGVDYHLSADSLLEELHRDLFVAHDAGNVIVSQSARGDTSRMSVG